MKILLVIPPVVYRRQPNIGVAYLSAYIKDKGYDVQVWDLNLEVSGINDGDDGFWAKKKNAIEFIKRRRSLFETWVQRILRYDPDIVGFNLWSTSREQALYLSRMIKKAAEKKLVVFGGPETVLGDNLFRNEQSVDILVRGEGEEAFLEIIEKYKESGRVESCRGCFVRSDGVLIDCGVRPEIKDLDRLPFPDFSAFLSEGYLFKGHVPISFGRGCKWKCTFCTVENCWRRYRARSASSIFGEIKQRLDEMDVKQFVNCDPALNQNLDMLSELCELIQSESLKIRWDGMAQVRPEMDVKYFKKMKEAGCVLLNYGVESGSRKVLGKMGKGYTPDQTRKVIKDTHAAGIDVVVNFIVGFPGETEEDFKKTLGFVESIKDYVLNVAYGHPCLVVPYNRLFRHPEEFSLKLNINDAYHWETVDGKNNSDVRENRVKEFNRFLNKLDINTSCGQDDRKTIEKEKTYG